MKIFGANWKTTVSAIGAAIFSALTLLAALPYELGEIANIFPPAWKAKIALVSAIAAFLLKIWNGIAQKSKEVTGGLVQQTASGAVVAEGQQNLVDETLRATDASGEQLTPEQKKAIAP